MKVLVAVFVLCFCGLGDANNETTVDMETTTQTPEPKPPRVLIIGAGIAAISAAHKLEDAGITDFLVLEGSGQIGGRIRSAQLGKYTLETGNMWVAGGKGNPIYDKSEWYGVNLTLMEYEDYIVRESGSANDLTEVFDVEYDTFEPAAEYLSNKTEAMLRDDLADLDQGVVFRQGGWRATTNIQHTLEQFEVDFEYSVPPHMASSKYTASGADDFPDEEYVGLGFHRLVEGLAQDVLLGDSVAHRLVLNATVSTVQQNSSHVTVITDDGTRYEVEHVIVTVSLGVLQNRLIDFEPQLPEWKLDAIDGFRFVHYLQIYLLFDGEPFWEDTEFILHASTNRGYYPIFTNFNTYLPGSNILQCVVFDSEAKRLSGMSESSIQAEIMQVLRTLYDATIPEPVEILVPNFSQDPLFMGAYSQWPPRYSSTSHKALQASVGRIHFAGDYGNVKHNGFVLGAYLSGFDTVARISGCVKDPRRCQDHKPIHEARGCTYKQAKNYDRHAREDDGSCRFPKFADSHATQPARSVAGMAVFLTLGRLASLFSQ